MRGTSKNGFCERNPNRESILDTSNNHSGLQMHIIQKHNKKCTLNADAPKTLPNLFSSEILHKNLQISPLM